MMEPTTKQHGNRMEFLDALRGIAAFVVVIQHTFEYISPAFNRFSATFFNFGQFGVVIFFLISGFIIPVTVERSNSLKLFWINRACRLFPVYWTSLAVVVVLYLLGRSEMPPIFVKHFAWSVIVNTTMLQLFLGVPNAIPSYWTLGMEIAFYILCSLLFAARLLSRPSLCAWFSALGLIAIVLLAGLGFHRSIPAGRLGLLVTAFVGTTLYGVYTHRSKLSDFIKVIPIVLLALTMGFWFRFHAFPAGDGESITFHDVLLTWIVAYAVFLVAYALRGHEFPSWLLWLGQISYSLYLMQSLIFVAMPWITNPYAIVIGNIAGSVAIAAVVNKFIERPATTYLKTQVRNLLLKPQPVAVAAGDS